MSSIDRDILFHRIVLFYSYAFHVFPSITSSMQFNDSFWLLVRIWSSYDVSLQNVNSTQR